MVEERTPSDDLQAAVQELVSAFCDGDISKEDFCTLELLVTENRVARREYLHLMKIHAELALQAKQRIKVSKASQLEKVVEVAQSSQTPTTQAAKTQPASQSSSNTRSWLLLYFAVAASVMIIAIYSFLRPRSGEDLPMVADGRQSKFALRGALDLEQSTEIPEQAIGKIVATSEMSRLFVGGVQVDSKKRVALFPGQEICLAGGTALIHFDNGIRSALQAPCVLVPESSMLVHVSGGSLTSTVSEAGIGFTVTTPEARVIDLGTSFGILAKLGGTTQVVVFDGEVDVMPLDGVTPEEDIDLVRLKMGEGVNLFSDGSIKPVVSFASSDYRMPISLDAERLQANGNTSLHSPISSVYDSLGRLPGRYSRYEIVVGGMREDVTAFADRRYHQWNGVDESGIPEYLVGGDYVKMTNDVRYIENYRVFITISRPTFLYILADDRAAPPQWLTDQFVDTGDDIGMDEGPHIHNSGNVLLRDLPGVGPGVSIDHLHSIWRKEINSPCTIECGAMLNIESEFNAENNYNKSAYNHVLYGIVAVPKE